MSIYGFVSVNVGFQLPVGASILAELLTSINRIQVIRIPSASSVISHLTSNVNKACLVDAGAKR